MPTEARLRPHLRLPHVLGLDVRDNVPSLFCRPAGTDERSLPEREAAMTWIDALKKGTEEFLDVLSEGWEKLRRRSAAGLTRFMRRPQADEVAGVPESEESWGLLSAEVCETDKGIVVRLEAPGMDAGDFEVSVERGHLLVRGEKRFEREHDAGRYHLFEAAYGAFERVVPLPVDVDASGAEASYARGVLSIRFPKAAMSSPTRIPIRD